MYLKNLQHNAPIEECEAEVYEFISEAKISGSTAHFSDNMLISPLIESPESEDIHPFQVKALYPNYPALPLDLEQATEDAYYHIGGVASELASLFALFYRARFYHISTIGGEITKPRAQMRTVHKPLRVKVPYYWDKEVFAGKDRNFTVFPAFLDKVLTLSGHIHLPVMKSAYNYNSALRQIGIDHEMVFVKLVSAIEALSAGYKLSPKDDPLSKLGDISHFTAEQQDELKGLIENRKAKRKFIRFIELYSKGYFKGGRFAAPDLKIKRADLSKVLSTIYDARSAYLHEGESMYLSVPFEDFNWDTDSSHGKYIGLRKFTAKKKLPYIHFFEGLVRHCILSYIDAHDK